MHTDTGTPHQRDPGLAQVGSLRSRGGVSAWSFDGGLSHAAKLLLLSALPLAGAALGAFVDEYERLGFTNWRSACRASGFSLGSTLAFSFELLPTAIIGLLAGGLALQAIGATLRHHGEEARLCLAAHAGCAVSMPIGMALCALAFPLEWMLLADLALALAGAWCVYLMAFRRGATATLRT